MMRQQGFEPGAPSMIRAAQQLSIRRNRFPEFPSRSRHCCWIVRKGENADWSYYGQWNRRAALTCHYLQVCPWMKC